MSLVPGDFELPDGKSTARYTGPVNRLGERRKRGNTLEPLSFLLSLCRSYDGFASRAPSERSGCRLRTGSIQKLAREGSGLFRGWNAVAAYRLFLLEEKETLMQRR